MKKTINSKLSLLAIIALAFLTPLKAQDALIYSKEIKLNNQNEIKETVNNLTLSLLTKTNASVCAQCNEENIVIIEGRIPITLSNNPFEVAYNFNGYINYQLEVNYNNGIELTFKNLQHESKNSINGFDLNYGQLLSNGSTAKNAVYRNYDFLSEDYRRVTLFETDEEIEKMIQEKAINNIDNLIAEK
ncbi:hypothetical protein [Carboxylicivirga linearis]|uniref:DUF4468 domain-containing protein n=1 Tax=Carboxylicivirga linearis TaxID=1628157 RepID=A0ABS5K010_9BACT|nr:hypothetical protein [Carboxylicivirga linearis]MBS2100453.1 hypothetical protein [Carboxylicivirga linearis]